MNAQELFESARPDMEPLSDAELELLFAEVFRREQSTSPLSTTGATGPVTLTAAVRNTARPHRPHTGRLVAAAVGGAVLVGGLIALNRRYESAPPVVEQPPPGSQAAAPPTFSEAPDTDEGERVAATTSGAPKLLPLDGLDPVDAARRVSPADLFSAIPDEQADLDVAAEILRRECLRAGGAAPPDVTVEDHMRARSATVERFLAVTDWLRSDGLAFMREHGYSGRATRDALWLPVAEGSLEAQLLIDGCNRAAADVELTRATGSAVNDAVIEFNNTRLFPEVFDAPAGHPTYGPVYAAFEDCMATAGYPTYSDDMPRLLAEFDEAGERPSAAELALAAADVHCRRATGLPRELAEVLISVVAEFAEQHADLIATVKAERAAALERARQVLIDHGIEPFT